jgi:alkylhydroperoxidase family enzyme
MAKTARSNGEFLMKQKFKTIPLPDINSLPKNVHDLLEHLPPLNVYKMVANVPSSLLPFVDLAQSFFKDGDVDTRLLEIGILRVAYKNNCDYQWHQHKQIAQSIGITEQELTSISSETTVSSLTAQENYICTLADELTINATINEKVFDDLFAQYSIKQGVALILCFSFYNMLSRFLNATRVEIEKNNPLEGKSSPL